MKKIVFAFLFIPVAFVSAQTAPVSCTNLSTNLARGTESKNVLALQNFLHAKGFLKATPNGYFGPGTLAAVKAYQKSVGLPQVGNTGPSTRAAIKKDSCGPLNVPSSSNTPQSQQSATSSAPVSAQVPSAVSGPQPVLSAVDMVGLFSGGETNWRFNIYGSGLSTTTNTVYVRSVDTRRTYTIGVFGSASGTIALPVNFTGTTFSCGTDCSEKLPPGRYDLFVSTVGGISEPKTLTIQSFTMSALSGAPDKALPSKVSGATLGTFSFSSGMPVNVHSVTFVTSTSTISTSAIGAVTMKDRMTGTVFKADVAMGAYQSKIFDAVGDVNNITPGTIYAYFTVEIDDYIGKHRTKFTSPPILMTVSGVL